MANPIDTTSSEKSWMGRNWPWVVPVGCLTVIVGFAVMALAIFALVMGVIKSSDVYQHAITTAKQSPETIQALGKPIEEKIIISGNINMNGQTGRANLSIPIYGPDGEGTIRAIASKNGGRWNYSTLQVHIKGTDRVINLLAQ